MSDTEKLEQRIHVLETVLGEAADYIAREADIDINGKPNAVLNFATWIKMVLEDKNYKFRPEWEV